MSALTRILNNQIYNSTIVGYQKIAPGTLTGTLFSSNVTVPGDFLITGNLTVLGSSAVTTVASTNTYVNDPLIVMNNGFSGTNTYDEGFVFNRATALNQAFIWSEFNQEFRLIGTSETGTTYGNVAVTNYANLHLGNLTVDYALGITSITTTGNVNVGAGVQITGDLAVNGGDLTTSQTTFNLLNATATTVNAFGAATGIRIGATSGELLINNPSIQGSQTTQNLFTANATTVNFATSATALTLGATSGFASVQNANIWLPNATTIGGAQATVALLNTNATTIDAFGDATTLTVGATTGTLTLRNATVTTPGQIVSTRAGSAVDGNGQIFLNGSTSNRIDWNINGTGGPSLTTRSAGTKLVLYPAVSGTSVDYAIGIDSATLWSSVAENDNSFNFKWFGGDIVVANLSGTGNFTTVGDVAVNGGDLTTTAATFNLIDAAATTVNFAGAGTTLTIGATTGTTTIRNAITALTGRANVGSTVDATSTTNAALTVAGGAGIAQTLIVGGGIFANSTTASTTTATGAIVVAGGAGIAGNLNVGGNLLVNSPATINSTLDTTGLNRFQNTTNTTGPDTGAVQVKGGVSINKDLWVQGNIYAGNIYGVTQEIITVKDPLLYLEAANTYPYSYDIGFYSQFVGPDSNTDAGNVYQHTGIVRDNLDNTWKFFSNIAAEPTGTIPFDSDTQYDPVKAGNLTLTFTQDATSTITGSFKTAGGIGLGGNIFMGGAYQDTSSTNALLFNTPTTVDAFKSATSLEVGATSGSLIINNPTVVGSQTTQALFDTVATTVNFARTGNVTMGAPTGTTTVQGNATIQSVQKSTAYNNGALTVLGGLGVTGNIFINDSYLDTAQSSVLVFNTPTTVDAFKAGTDIEIGATSGTVVINNPTVRGSQTTQNLYNTVATTINFGGEANVTVGTPSGITTIRGDTNVRATTNSITYTQGALTVAGGVGVAGNVSIAAGPAGRITVGAELVNSDISPENQVAIIANVAGPVRSTILNLNSGSASSVEFTAIADNGSNVSNYISTGITSSGYNVAGSALTSTTGYSLAVGGSYYLGSLGNDVGILLGGLQTGNVITKFYNATSNVAILTTTAATSPTTGALTVAGGVGINANLYVSTGAVINNDNSTQPFVVKSSTSGNIAIFANTAVGSPATTETVIIGGNDTTPQPGVILKISGPTSFMMPVGPSSARPSSITGNVATDVPGMMRFNTTINNMEFYDGTQWSTAGSSLTVISDRQFAGNTAYGNVDGTNDTFTIQSSSTTAATIVSINGVMQFPVLAYSVSGATLTFTEPPALDDVIDVRVLATTTTVSVLASGNGLNQFIADDVNGSEVWTGTSSTIKRVLFNPVGDMELLTGNKVTYEQVAVNIAANATPYVIATFSTSSYTSAKYVIQAKKDSTNVETMEALVMTDGANAYVTTYGIINNGTAMGTLTANVQSGNVNIWYTTTTAMTNANVKAMGTYIV